MVLMGNLLIKYGVAVQSSNLIFKSLVLANILHVHPVISADKH